MDHHIAAPANFQDHGGIFCFSVSLHIHLQVLCQLMADVKQHLYYIYTYRSPTTFQSIPDKFLRTRRAVLTILFTKMRDTRSIFWRKTGVLFCKDRQITDQWKNCLWEGTCDTTEHMSIINSQCLSFSESSLWKLLEFLVTSPVSTTLQTHTQDEPGILAMICKFAKTWPSDFFKLSTCYHTSSHNKLLRRWTKM
jgi:hypothetical protein